MRVTAEGVEELAQVEFLRSLECDEAQGFYFGRPMSADNFAMFLLRGIGEVHADARGREGETDGGVGPALDQPEEGMPAQVPPDVGRQERVQIAAFGGTIEYFRDTVFNYPTLAEAFKVAALDGLNKL